MAEINFSTQDTGVCPYCKKHNNCHIQDAITDLLADETNGEYEDDVMELVIYECPEFVAEKYNLND